MRKSKFRGTTNTGVTIFGSLVYSNNIQPSIYFEIGEGKYKSFDWAYVDPETVGEWTGLYDGTKWEELTKDEQMNFIDSPEISDCVFPESKWKGKELYEGDTVQRIDDNGFSSKNGEIRYSSWIVIFIKGRFEFKSTDYSPAVSHPPILNSHDFEIIKILNPDTNET